MMLYTQKYRCGWVIISLLLVLLGTGRNDLYAQDRGCKVSGNVITEVPGGGIPKIAYAGITLVSGKDSLWTSSNSDGYFVFKGVRPGVARIRVSHASFQMFESDLELEEGDNYFLIKLDRIVLAEASVTSEAPLVTHRKDTTIYNSAAVRTMEGDYAIEILRQMPGVEIRNGKIYVDGQQVKRTYVNGRLIFGNGVITPFGSLLADEVVNIKSYEEESVEAKERGLKNSLKERVLDITTKNPVFSAFDGYASASAGIDEKKDINGDIQGRYIAGLNANFFSERLLAYFTGYANNVGWGSNQFSSYNNLPGALQSYQEKAAVKTGLEKYWGNRLNPTMLRLSYAFDKGYGRNESLSKRDYFEAETSPARSSADTISSSSTDKAHTIDMLFSFNNESVGTIYTKNLITLSRRESFGTTLSSLTASDGEQYRQNRLQADNTVLKSCTGDFIWDKRNFDSGIRPSVLLNISYGKTSADGFLVDTLSSTFTKKHLEISGSDNDYNISVGGSIGKAIVNKESVTLDLNLGYAVSKQRVSRYKMSLDVLDVDNPVTDLVNSYDYNWDVIGHGPSLTGNIHFPGSSVVFNSKLMFNHITDSESFPYINSSGHRFIVPDVNIGYYMSNILRVEINCSGRIPSIEQLRDRIDDRNAFYLHAGNPGLRQERTNHLMLDVSLLNKGNRRLRFEGNFDVNLHPIILKQTYYSTDTHIDGWGGYDAKAGTALTTYENAPLSMTLSPTLQYSNRIQKRKINYRVTLGTTYSLRPQYLSDKLVNMNEIVPSYSIWAGYSPSHITRLSLTHGLSYVRSFNSLGQTMPDIISGRVGFSGRVQFLKRCIARVEYSFISNNYLDDSYKDMYRHRLDALVSVSLLKGRLGISISGNDLLNRGTSFTVTTNANYQDITWNPSYGRYFMLNVVYRLNKTSSKTSFMGVLKE